nr:hypothetical protein [Propionivibrio sp.]
MDPETLLLFNRATTLQERIRAFSQGIGEGRQTHARDSAAVIRIWKEKLGNKTDALQKRSEWAGFRVEDVEDILCTSPIKEGDLPFWATELASLLEFSRANTDTAHREMRPQRSDRIFPEVFALFEAYAQRTLKEHLANHGLAIDTLLGLEAQNNVFDSLLSRLASVAEGPLYFEFDNSRSAGLRLMAGAYTHADDPPADEAKFGTRYYDEFLQRLLETALYSLFSVYPVLGRLIGTILAQWREATVIWLIRLANDRERLEKINELAPGTLGLVKAAVLD